MHRSYSVGCALEDAFAPSQPTARLAATGLSITGNDSPVAAAPKKAPSHRKKKSSSSSRRRKYRTPSPDSEYDTPSSDSTSDYSEDETQQQPMVRQPATFTPGTCDKQTATRNFYGRDATDALPPSLTSATLGPAGPGVPQNVWAGTRQGGPAPHINVHDDSRVINNAGQVPIGDLAGTFTDPNTGQVYAAFTQQMPAPRILREPPVITLGQGDGMLQLLTGETSYVKPCRKEIVNDFQDAIETATFPDTLLSLRVEEELKQRAARELFFTNRETETGYNDTHWDGYIGTTYVMRPTYDTQTLRDNDETNTTVLPFREIPDGNAAIPMLSDGTEFGGWMQPSMNILARNKNEGVVPVQASFGIESAVMAHAPVWDSRSVGMETTNVRPATANAPFSWEASSSALPTTFDAHGVDKTLSATHAAKPMGFDTGAYGAAPAMHTDGSGRDSSTAPHVSATTTPAALYAAAPPVTADVSALDRTVVPHAADNRNVHMVDSHNTMSMPSSIGGNIGREHLFGSSARAPNSAAPEQSMYTHQSLTDHVRSDVSERGTRDASAAGIMGHHQGHSMLFEATQPRTLTTERIPRKSDESTAHVAHTDMGHHRMSLAAMPTETATLHDSTLSMIVNAHQNNYEITQPQHSVHERLGNTGDMRVHTHHVGAQHHQGFAQSAAAHGSVASDSLAVEKLSAPGRISNDRTIDGQVTGEMATYFDLHKVNPDSLFAVYGYDEQERLLRNAFIDHRPEFENKVAAYRPTHADTRGKLNQPFDMYANRGPNMDVINALLEQQLYSRSTAANDAFMHAQQIAYESDVG